MTYSGQTTTLTRFEPWTFRDNSWLKTNITGYRIDALDGEIGNVDKAKTEVDSSFLIVEMGPPSFGQRVMLPAGVVSGVDHQNKRVFVERTKDQIKNAPEFHQSLLDDMKFRDSLSRYYGEHGAGWYQPR